MAQYAPKHVEEKVIINTRISLYMFNLLVC